MTVGLKIHIITIKILVEIIKYKNEKKTPRSNLRSCRRRLDKTQPVVAEELKALFPCIKISDKHISALETNDNRQPSLEVARALVKYYKEKLQDDTINIDYLFPDSRF